MSNEKFELKFIVGNDPEMKERFFMAFDHTGIDTKKPDHKLFVELMGKIVAAALFAKANGVHPEEIEF